MSARSRRRRRRKQEGKNQEHVKAPVCPYCGSPSKLQDSSVIYGRSYGPAWVCSKYPECDAYVGCHPHSKRPLGRLANRELRAAKMQVHKALDPLWKSGEMRRHEAYAMLAAGLGITQEECHVGMFDLEMCMKAVEIVKQYKQQVEAGDVQ